jgi:lambda family phage portal protein
VARESMPPNPFTHSGVRSAGFFSTDVNRLLAGWENTSHSIDHYLKSELRDLRSRSRKAVRANPYGKRFISMIKSNVVGPNGINIQAQVARLGLEKELDTTANDALEASFREWGQKHCDYYGRLSWVDMQNMTITSAGQDGEFLYQRMFTGPHGYQLRAIDPELLDVNKNEKTKNGEIRLGVEYNAVGKRINYWFRKGYDSWDTYSISANQIIHGFISEWPDQSRGIPWLHASLERLKHLEKYEESAIVKARSTAATFGVMRSVAGDEPYEGDEDLGNGVSLDQYEAGTIKDIGDREFQNIDSDYPHQMYAAFVKAQLQGIASGLGISYHALASDLEGVNYSSIRAGVLEDREVFKGLQNWFVRSFVRPVYEDWLQFAHARDAIKIGSVPLKGVYQAYMAAHYQPRRWAWVDPQKDGAANKLAIDERLKSRSQVMREMGDDPESTWMEIQREEQLLEKLGIQPIVKELPQAEDKSDE